MNSGLIIGIIQVFLSSNLVAWREQIFKARRREIFIFSSRVTHLKIGSRANYARGTAAAATKMCLSTKDGTSLSPKALSLPTAGKPVSNSVAGKR